MGRKRSRKRKVQMHIIVSGLLSAQSFAEVRRVIPGVGLTVGMRTGDATIRAQRQSKGVGHKMVTLSNDRERTSHTKV
ncbi:hypothetical protein LSTR_LSTR016629 [Laodelphax striatellus]|uniref:Uncharacterized protein n=1 Tax=Laodelphax striatellus TaxID=195883 RepID=A0A482XD94_LAOST|nr:hypothetical protein LSTR_LSTR016629 [Laodelphax striatellus]